MAVIVLGCSLKVGIPGQVRTCQECLFWGVSEKKGVISKDLVSTRLASWLVIFSTLYLAFIILGTMCRNLKMGTCNSIIQIFILVPSCSLVTS